MPLVRMSSFASMVLWSLVHAVDPSPAEVTRLEAFAGDVSHAVDVAPEFPFRGPAAREGAIAALLVTAWHESGFRPAIVECRERGDHGRSITAFQLMRGMAWGPFSEEQLCGSVELAATRALAVLTVHARCSTPRAIWRGYATGDCGRRARAAGEMCGRWAWVLARVGIEGASCDVSRPLTWKDEER